MAGLHFCLTQGVLPEVHESGIIRFEAGAKVVVVIPWIYEQVTRKEGAKAVCVMSANKCNPIIQYFVLKAVLKKTQAMFPKQLQLAGSCWQMQMWGHIGPPSATQIVT